MKTKQQKNKIYARKLGIKKKKQIKQKNRFRDRTAISMTLQQNQTPLVPKPKPKAHGTKIPSHPPPPASPFNMNDDLTTPYDVNTPMTNKKVKIHAPGYSYQSNNDKSGDVLKLKTVSLADSSASIVTSVGG